jgi:uncharacterized protein (DUF885 family)
VPQIPDAPTPRGTSSPLTVHAVCDRFVAQYAELDPIGAVGLGIAGAPDRLTDYTPQGFQARAELRASAQRAVFAAEARDAHEAAARDAFVERMGIELEMHEAGLHAVLVNVIACPLQQVRRVFDSMPTADEDDWSAIARRLADVPEALAGLRTSLREAAHRGQVSASRQVISAAGHCEPWAEGLVSLASRAKVMPALRADLDAAVAAAASAFATMADFLRGELAPRAPDRDAVGPDAYGLWLRYFTGSRQTPEDAYEWGWQEFHAIEAEMRRVARRIKSGATPAEAADALNQDPLYSVDGIEALCRWARERSAAALSVLRDVHFDISDPLVALEHRAAPPGSGGGASYSGPSEDFSRPGTVWWAGSPGQRRFPTWRMATTVFHEGLPGHHLQIGTAVHQAGRLNRCQRLMGKVSGYTEGWALYAERLSRDLGLFADDAELLGFLDAQLFRAARVIVDIGMHLELRIPAGAGFHDGRQWSPELGAEFLASRTLTAPNRVREEIDRYLGWPGQAASYKLGERVWWEAAASARTSGGAAFDLREFHSAALSAGPMGLDLLRDRFTAEGSGLSGLSGLSGPSGLCEVTDR